MINGDSLRAVDAAQWTTHFIRPLYDSYCFSQIPRLVRAVFDPKGETDVPASMFGPCSGDYDTVILFFIDAFGWRFFEPRCEKYPFLNEIVRDGAVSKITSQFPSTTAAHVTAVHTGLPPGQSGVYEWFYYEPRVDAIIAPLNFSFAGDYGRNTLQPTNVSPADLFPRHTLYQDLGEQGVRSLLFQSREYSRSPYTDTVAAGARIVPYTTLPEALATMAGMLEAERERAYYVLYFANIDTVCHLYGPTSSQVDAEIDTFLTVMERVFQRAMAGTRRKTLVLLVADHGQVQVDPATTVYLNLSLPSVARYMKTSRAGRLLVPAGSPRDMFLYIKDDYLDEAQAVLTQHLEGRAEVYRTADLIDRHFFGPGAPSSAFLERAGNLVILPYAHESVWWFEKDRFEQRFRGHHGGSTREEMETVLLARSYG
jgi:predicted AlkP superfamily pyrophosphatase or phosphodiesterase